MYIFLEKDAAVDLPKLVLVVESGDFAVCLDVRTKERVNGNAGCLLFC
jgi:hypothetical protein